MGSLDNGTLRISGEECNGKIQILPDTVLFQSLYPKFVRYNRTYEQEAVELKLETILYMLLNRRIVYYEGNTTTLHMYQYIDKVGDEWEPCTPEELLQKSYSKNGFMTDSNATWSIKPLPLLITNKPDLEFNDFFDFQSGAYSEKLRIRFRVPGGNIFCPPLVREIFVYLANLVPLPHAIFPWIIPFPCVYRTDQPGVPGLLYVDRLQEGKAQICVTFSLKPDFHPYKVILKSTL